MKLRRKKNENCKFATKKIKGQMTGRIAKPFLKWAGGKTQLISDIEKALPRGIMKLYIHLNTENSEII